jgi:hypothetical protein
MNAPLCDIRYGFRSLLQSPPLAGVATLALTIGIALTTTMFSILVMALGLSRFLTIILFEVQPRDPVIFGGAAVVLIATGLAAVSFRRSALLGWIPSLR